MTGTWVSEVAPTAPVGTSLGNWGAPFRGGMAWPL
jgi:hypothetical protein